MRLPRYIIYCQNIRIIDNILRFLDSWFWFLYYVQYIYLSKNNVAKIFARNINLKEDIHFFLCNKIISWIFKTVPSTRSFSLVSFCVLNLVFVCINWKCYRDRDDESTYDQNAIHLETCGLYYKPICRTLN